VYGYFTFAAAVAAVCAVDLGLRAALPTDDDPEVEGLFDDPEGKGDLWAELDSERRFR
jgi:hypothetical protein